MASGVTHLVAIIPAFEKDKLPIGEKINTFSTKYQTWLGKRPTGDVTVGTVITLDIAKITISLTGITEYAKALVKSQAIYAISLGCKQLMGGLYNIEGDWYSFDDNNSDKITLYLTQLAQSRIVGEYNICGYLTTWSLSNMISKLITHSSNEEITNNFKIILNYLYSCAYTLNLKLSSELPVYQNGKWTSYGKAEKKPNGQLKTI